MVSSKLGQRRQNRLNNDRHVHNEERAFAESSTDGSEDEDTLEDFYDLSISYTSTFQELAKTENQDVLETFLSVTESPYAPPVVHPNPKAQTLAQQVFTQLPKHTRSVLIHMMPAFFPFFSAIERLLLSFGKWNEIPCRVEFQDGRESHVLDNVQINAEMELELSLSSPVYRLIFYQICQFYGFRTQTMVSDEETRKTIRVSKLSSKQADRLSLSLCEYVMLDHLTPEKQQRCGASLFFNDVRSCASEEEEFHLVQDVMEYF